MRNSKCKKLRKYAKQFNRGWALQTWQQLYSKMKNVYKNTIKINRAKLTTALSTGNLDVLHIQNKKPKKTLKNM